MMSGMFSPIAEKTVEKMGCVWTMAFTSGRTAYTARCSPFSMLGTRCPPTTVPSSVMTTTSSSVQVS